MFPYDRRQSQTFLRSAICDFRSSAIVWKAVLKGHIATECPKMNFKFQKSGCGGNHHTLMHRYTTATGGEPKTGTGLKENKVVDSNNGNAEQQSRA